MGVVEAPFTWGVHSHTSVEGGRVPSLHIGVDGEIKETPSTRGIMVSYIPTTSVEDVSQD